MDETTNPNDLVEPEKADRHDGPHDSDDADELGDSSDLDDLDNLSDPEDVDDMMEVDYPSGTREQEGLEYQARRDDLEASDDLEDLDGFGEPNDEEDDSFSRNARATRLRQALSNMLTLERFFSEEMLAKDIRKLMSEVNSATESRSVLDQIQDGTKERSSIQRYATGLRILGNKTKATFESNFRIVGLMDLAINTQLVKYDRCRICSKKGPPVEPIESDPVSTLNL